MAVGRAGRAVQTTALVRPRDFADRVGSHIHSGAPEATCGAPGSTQAPGGPSTSQPSTPSTSGDGDS
jgi:hypothetical protein